MSKVKAMAISSWESFKEDPMISITNMFMSVIAATLLFWATIISGAFIYATTQRIIHIASAIMANAG
jgi:hypothetical protein